MQSTIWLDAFIRQLFATNSGNFANGLNSKIPVKKKKNTKNIEEKIAYENRMPNKIMNIGIK